MPELSAADELARVDAALDELLARGLLDPSSEREFWCAQYDHGLAWVHFPVGSGGLGVAPSLQAHVDSRIVAAGGSTRNRPGNVVGIGYAAATVLAHASPELRDRILRPTFAMEEIWCQLFSEPGSGSDLAGLATHAVRDGEEWIVNGQKVWTSFAHVARWALLLARTDPDVPKHRGLTFFILDMQSPGIDVRPLYEMTGEAEFNEVFLDDVRVPDSYRLGDVGAGWSVAISTLANERVSAGGGAGGASSYLGRAGVLWDPADPTAPVRRHEFVQQWIAVEVLRLLTARATAARGGAPDGTLMKLAWAELNKDATSFVINALGAQGMLYPDGYQFGRPAETEVATEQPHKAFLRSRANSIEGGTTEIMKNILGERVLGLPPEDRADRDRPWRDVPRS